MSFYSGLAATASRLIRSKGQPMVVSAPRPSAYDPATGVVVPAASSFDAYGVSLDYPLRYVDGTTIRVGDRQVYMESGTDPSGYTRVAYDGATGELVGCKPLSPAGAVVLYELQVRFGGG